MKARKFASLVLAALLQIVPLARQWLAALPLWPGIAVVFRWGVGAAATLGAFDAVSGASTVITSPTTATGTNGVAFTYRITTGPEVANTFSAAPLPANLVCATNTGYITGIPVTNGTFIVKLTASDHNRPDRTVTTNLTLTIVPAVVLTPPTITTQPQSQTVIAGNSATFTVVATGTAPLRYQWRFNGANLAGATSASLVTTQAGNYSVVVSNVAGSVASATATLTVNAATALFTLSVTGNGSVSPNLNGQSLVIGQTYTLTAMAEAGYVFAGWSGSMSGTDPTIRFVMSAGFALQAAFAPAPTTIAGGSYAGLFYETDGARYAHAGLITFTAAGRHLSGTLRIGATRYTFNGRSRAVSPGQVPLDVTLRPEGTASAVGTVGDGTWTADAVADRAAEGAARFAGTYEVRLPDGSSAVARVNTRGMLKLTGRLVNGARVRERVTLAEDGTWPLYLPTRGGAFIGWMKLANGSADGEVLWLPANSP